MDEDPWFGGAVAHLFGALSPESLGFFKVASRVSEAPGGFYNSGVPCLGVLLTRALFEVEHVAPDFSVLYVESHTQLDQISLYNKA